MVPLYRYSTEDLIWDESFRQWILTPTASRDRVWKKQLAENPDMACKVQIAREIILALQCESTTLEASEIKARVREVLKKIS